MPLLLKKCDLGISRETKTSSLKYKKYSDKSFILWRYASITWELNVGRYSFGIISLWSIMVTLEYKSIHSGVWLSVMIYIFRTHGINFFILFKEKYNSLLLLNLDKSVAFWP